MWKCYDDGRASRCLCCYLWTSDSSTAPAGHEAVLSTLWMIPFPGYYIWSCYMTVNIPFELNLTAWNVSLDLPQRVVLKADYCSFSHFEPGLWDTYDLRWSACTQIKNHPHKYAALEHRCNFLKAPLYPDALSFIWPQGGDNMMACVDMSAERPRKGF